MNASVHLHRIVRTIQREGGYLNKKVLAVVPARYGSTRFPGKMVELLAGKPLVMHAYLRAQSASLVDEALVATDGDIDAAVDNMRREGLAKARAALAAHLADPSTDQQRRDQHELAA